MQRRLAKAVLLAIALVSVLPSFAAAYQGQVPANVTVSGPLGTITCGQAYTLSATVFDTNGVKVDAQSVTWTEVAKPLTATDTTSPTSSMTDANGVATTSVTFGSPAGSRTFRATAGTAFGQIVLNVTGCSGNPPPVQVQIGQCESALGLDPSSGFGQSTKLQEAGRYITFRLSFGPEYAGKLIIVTHAFRTLPPATPNWGSFLGATGRVADSNGDVLYHFRSNSPAWISVRGIYPGSTGLDPAVSTACQGRWR